MTNKKQRDNVSYAKYTKKYNFEYDISEKEHPVIKNNQNDIENIRLPVKSVFTIVITVVSLLYFCFNVYKEYSHNMEEIKIIHVNIENDISELDKKLETLISNIKSKK